MPAGVAGLRSNTFHHGCHPEAEDSRSEFEAEGSMHFRCRLVLLDGGRAAAGDFPSHHGCHPEAEDSRSEFEAEGSMHFPDRSRSIDPSLDSVLPAKPNRRSG